MAPARRNEGVARDGDRRGRLLPPLLFASLLCACAGAKVEDPSYVYRSDDDYVRLVPRERGAPANSHPFDVSADRLTALLAGINVKGAASTGTNPVFTKEELDKIAAPLAAALSRASADEDVAFRISAHRGLLGAYSSESATAGRAFVRDGSLNLIFGAVQEFTRGSGHMSTPPPAIAPGSRSPKSGPTVWKLASSRGQLRAGRQDWLVFDDFVAPRTFEVLPERVQEPTPTADDREREIENRLRSLDRLRERGAITEEEYVERRREILREL